jgi:hypothetical protein
VDRVSQVINRALSALPIESSHSGPVAFCEHGFLNGETSSLPPAPISADFALVEMGSSLLPKNRYRDPISKEPIPITGHIMDKDLGSGKVLLLLGAQGVVPGCLGLTESVFLLHSGVFRTCKVQLAKTLST